MKTPSRWISSDHKPFELIAIYNPNEENDPWAQYVNTQTGQEYTCRLEAFQARFQPVLD
jgi:hypothetical protein